MATAVETPAALNRTKPSEPSKLDPKTLFFLGLLLAASGLVSPPIALVGGITFGLTLDHPFHRESSKLSKLLLQISVVAMGFGMNLAQVVHAGRSGFLYTAISITGAMVLGLVVGKLLQVAGKSSFLITAGTAICGGSAIAAVAPITEASEEEISVAMGTVFLLNSIALLIFPAIGWALHLNQNQFGLWCALAIHDTSSVVGAAARYGNQALAIGTTVKLARALWIVPVSLLTAAYMSRKSTSGKKAKVKIPWFIFLFVVASVANTYLPQFAAGSASLNHLGRTGLTATLFLIGTGLSKKTLQQVGVRPLVQGVVLWIVVATASLAAIYYGVISI
ncbi:putative sulfate exporter family transporter [Granulicella sp. WH15]|uniref:YeiH family protein n=1 Tax=Granulicella sp. WH15 TaxID=2602070 RepID=UPI0013677CB7|nr:putative sulfate exporter family transporter [Granulicella sp. WH15]QHN02278.1 putative sulfate exporter family transporter [Granulicella sp. WH15]